MRAFRMQAWLPEPEAESAVSFALLNRRQETISALTYEILKFCLQFPDEKHPDWQ
jgi:hypothetical protein